MSIDTDDAYDLLVEQALWALEPDSDDPDHGEVCHGVSAYGHLCGMPANHDSYESHRCALPGEYEAVCSYEWTEDSEREVSA